MLRKFACASALTLLFPLPCLAGDRCAQIVQRLGSQLADVTCFESADLTTNNVAPPPSGPTTLANNSLPGLPPFSFTPITDRATIAPSAAKRAPITKAVPGVQIQARIVSDPLGQARFLLRLPDDWNGRLVVAGASGTRSEFNGDFAWSDYVVQKGYAYASQNKGVLNFRLSGATDPQACRLNPDSATYVNFYDNGSGQDFTRWGEYIIKAAELARDGVHARYGRGPQYTYAVGTSNGGYQVRRAIETAPLLFDGGVDWEGTFVDERAPNLLADLPASVLNWTDYAASGFNPNSTAAKNFRAAGYPPDLVAGAASFWKMHWTSFWELTTMPVAEASRSRLQDLRRWHGGLQFPFAAF